MQCRGCGALLAPTDNEGYCGFCKVVLDVKAYDERTGWNGARIKPPKKRKKCE